MLSEHVSKLFLGLPCKKAAASSHHSSRLLLISSSHYSIFWHSTFLFCSSMFPFACLLQVQTDIVMAYEICIRLVFEVFYHPFFLFCSANFSFHMLAACANLSPEEGGCSSSWNALAPISISILNKLSLLDFILLVVPLFLYMWKLIHQNARRGGEHSAASASIWQTVSHSATC